MKTKKHTELPYNKLRVFLLKFIENKILEDGCDNPITSQEFVEKICKLDKNINYTERQKAQIVGYIEHYINCKYIITEEEIRYYLRSIRYYLISNGSKFNGLFEIYVDLNTEDGIKIFNSNLPSYPPSKILSGHRCVKVFSNYNENKWNKNYIQNGFEEEISEDYFELYWQNEEDDITELIIINLQREYGKLSVITF